MLAGSCPTGRTTRTATRRAAYLRGQNPERRQTCRSAGGAADEVRACDQSQDGEADRPDDSAECARQGG